MDTKTNDEKEILPVGQGEVLLFDYVIVVFLNYNL